MKALIRGSGNILPMWLRRSIKHIPGVATTQRWIVSHTLSGEPFVHTINAGPAGGLRFEVTLPEDKAIWAGIFEPEFSQALRDATHKGDVCYDIGGYRGYMSGVLALAGASQVVVFEPLPENIVRLKRLLELNPQLPIRIEQLAIGGSDGGTHFKVMSDQSMGKLVSSSFQQSRDFERDVVVQIARLDTFVFEGKAPAPDLIKIDVEGTEAEVIEGAQRTLTKYQPKILLEAHSEALAVLCRRRLEEFGYQLRELQTHADNHEGTRHFMAERSR
jgi:FkbM family methyltransferase